MQPRNRQTKPKSMDKPATTKIRQLTKQQVDQTKDLVTKMTNTSERPKRNITVPDAHKLFYDSLAKRKKNSTISSTLSSTTDLSKKAKNSSSNSSTTNSTISSTLSSTTDSSKMAKNSSSNAAKTNKINTAPVVTDSIKKAKKITATNNGNNNLQQPLQIRQKRAVKIPETRKEFYESMTNRKRNPASLMEKIRKDKYPVVVVEKIVDNKVETETNHSTIQSRTKRNVKVPVTHKIFFETIVKTKENPKLSKTAVPTSTENKSVNKKEKIVSVSVNKKNAIDKPKPKAQEKPVETPDVTASRTKRTIKVPEAHKNFFQTIAKGKNSKSVKDGLSKETNTITSTIGKGKNTKQVKDGLSKVENTTTELPIKSTSTIAKGKNGKQVTVDSSKESDGTELLTESTATITEKDKNVTDVLSEEADAILPTESISTVDKLQIQSDPVVAIDIEDVPQEKSDFRMDSFPKTRHKAKTTKTDRNKDSRPNSDALNVPSEQISKPTARNKLKKPLKRLQALTSKNVPTNINQNKNSRNATSSSLATNPVKENQHRLPIYKQVPTDTNIATTAMDDNSIYDYFSNSQDSGSTTANNPMHDLIEKLRREKKIYLNRKPKNKQTTTKKQQQKSKPLWNGDGKRINLKKNLIELRNRIENSLKDKSHHHFLNGSKSNENIPHISIDNSTTDDQNDDTESVDYQDDCYNNVDDHHDDIPDIDLVVNDDPLEHIDLSKSVQKTYPSKSPQKSNDRLQLNKPTHQSTPVRMSPNVAPSASPWRVEPEQILNVLSNRTKTSVTIHDTTTPATTCQPSDSRKESTSDAAISAGKRLRYTQFELERNNSRALAAESSNLNASMNLSNIENIEPPNHQNVRETITFAGANKALPRSPLKSLAIRNIRLSPHKQIKHIDIGTSKTIELPMTTISNSSNDTARSDGSMREPSIRNCFGFDSDIDENDNESGTENLQKASPTKIQRQVREKMKKLKKFIPSTTMPTKVVAAALPPPPPRMAYQKRNIFFTPIEPKKQQNLPQLIKLNAESQLKTNQANREATSPIIIGENIENRSCSPVLFTSFWENDKGEVKSYSRGNKRKRHISINYSDDEDDEDEMAKRHKPSRGEKRKNREKKIIDKQLDVFANEFNSMCKSIEEFDILVEKH